MNALISQFALGFALLAGAVIPIQAAANATLGRNLGHPLWATLISLSVSAALGLLLISWLRLPLPTAAMAVKGPLWSWFGGLCGLIYVLSAVAIAPKLGVTTFMAAVVTGQLVIALMLDHFGWFGLVERPLSWSRLLAAVLIVSGVLLLHFSNQQRPAALAQPATAEAKLPTAAAASVATIAASISPTTNRTH